MEYRRGVDAATSAPLLPAGGNGHLTEMHHSSHPPPRRKPGFFAGPVNRNGISTAPCQHKREHYKSAAGLKCMRSSDQPSN